MSMSRADDLRFPAIRQARPAEAALLSRFMADVFLDAYGHSAGRDDVMAHVRGSFNAARQSRELADPEGVFLVVGPPGDYAGYAHLLFGEDAPAGLETAAPVELRRFYLHRDQRGRGLAAELMERAKAVARDRGADAIWLSVWQQSPQAIRFYRKHGFDMFGTAPFPIGATVQTDWLMACVLA